MGREDYQQTLEQGVSSTDKQTDKRKRPVTRSEIFGKDPYRTGPTGSPLPSDADPDAVRHDIEFEETVDMVNEMGCDPTGTQPIEEKIEHVAKHNRLLIFPTGTYRISDSIELGHLRNFGMYGDGRVTFELDSGVQAWVPSFESITNGLFEGITIDQTAPEAIAWTRFTTEERIHVEDIDVRGTDDLASAEKRKWRCLLVGNEPSATITMKNVVSRVENVTDAVSRDSGGVFIGSNNKGTVGLVGCKFNRDPGIHAPNAHGRVLIRGGTYRRTETGELVLPPRSTTQNVTVLESDPR